MNHIHSYKSLVCKDLTSILFPNKFHIKTGDWYLEPAIYCLTGMQRCLQKQCCKMFHVTFCRNNAGFQTDPLVISFKIKSYNPLQKLKLTRRLIHILWRNDKKVAIFKASTQYQDLKYTQCLINIRKQQSAVQRRRVEASGRLVSQKTCSPFISMGI